PSTLYSHDSPIATTPRSSPYTTLFRSPPALAEQRLCVLHFTLTLESSCSVMRRETALGNAPQERQREIMKFITEQLLSSESVKRSEEHTSELQSRENLVCRLLLEKKKI